MRRKRYQFTMSVLLLSIALGLSCGTAPQEVKNKLAEWHKGVWISGDGTYTIYTDDHYFVVSFDGDSLSPNLYFGASQLAFHNKGTARKQAIRLRQMPGGSMNMFKELARSTDSTEVTFKYDSALFTPGTCNIKDGVIYDAFTEVTPEYILLATCNGDKEKIFSSGISVYLPAGGGEFYSYRVEKF